MLESGRPMPPYLSCQQPATKRNGFDHYSRGAVRQPIWYGIARRDDGTPGHVAGDIIGHAARLRSPISAVRSAGVRRMLSMRAHDHDATDAHPIGSTDGDRWDSCGAAADISSDAPACALSASSHGPEAAPPMNSGPTSSPSIRRDAADHDQPYTWGRPPSTYLAPREVVRLMIFRSRLEERQMLRHRGRAPRSRRPMALRRSS